MPKQSIELFKEILELSQIVHHSLCASPPVRQVKKSNSPKGEKKHYLYLKFPADLDANHE
jgi:hypothetical protein